MVKCCCAQWRYSEQLPVQIGQIMLAGSTVSWSERVNHPQHILAKESKVAFCLNLTPIQSLYLRVVPFCTAVLNTSKISVPSTLLLIQYVPASYFPVSSPVKPHGNKPFLFHPRETPIYFKFESLIKILRSHNKDLC